MTRHRHDYEHKSHWKFLKGPRVDGRYPKAGAYCRTTGVRSPEATYAFFQKEAQAAKGLSQTKRHRDNAAKTNRRGVVPIKTRAQRKTTAARKKRTIIDIRSPRTAGRHAKKK